MILALLSLCAPQQGRSQSTVRRFTLVSPDTVLGAAFFSRSRVLEEILAQLNRRIRLPQPVTIVPQNCEQGSMSYRERRISVCIEFADDIWFINLRHIPLGSTSFTDIGPALAIDELDRTAAVTGFVLLHEVGHALIDLLALPITGRAEAAADQFAAWFSELYIEIPPGLPRTTQTGIRLWQMPRRTAEFLQQLGRQDQLPPGVRVATLRELADVHGLPEQRAFDLECMWRGKAASAIDFSSPVARDVGLSVNDWSVPGGRSGAECLLEWQRIDRSWRQLLGAHLIRETRRPRRVQPN